MEGQRKTEQLITDATQPYSYIKKLIRENIIELSFGKYWGYQAEHCRLKD